LNRSLVLESNASLADADYVLLGVPFDGTCTYRPGARFAPLEVRREFLELEKESGGKCFFDLKFHDAGNVDVVYGNAAKTLERVGETVGEIFYKNAGAKLITLGGEHLITLPVVKALSQRRRFSVVSLDAHLDLKDEYVGERLSHSSVMRRIHEMGIGVAEIGVRTFDKGELEYAKKSGIRFCGTDVDDVEKVLAKVKGDVYLSIDFDCLDPAYAPGVGTPEPMGLSTTQLSGVVQKLRERTVALDLTEICPPFDCSSITSVAAARILLDFLLS